jgi:hypothetical protein
MHPEPSWFARIWEYLSSTGVYWWGAIAVLIALERYAERLFHNFWKTKVDPVLTPEIRKKILIIFALVAFAYGNFRAFDSERQAKEQAIQAKEQAISEQKAAFPRDQNSLYQSGIAVATTTEPQIDAISNIIVFPVVTSTKTLNNNIEYEFRDWKLTCSGEGTVGMRFGAIAMTSYPQFICRIQGAR